MNETKKVLSIAEHVLLSSKSVLIKTSERDDALYYQASVSTQNNARAVCVTTHETSLLLERVRLMGSLLVIVETDNATKYWGELRIGNNHARNQLILEFFDRAENSSCDEQRLLPIT